MKRFIEFWRRRTFTVGWDLADFAVILSIIWSALIFSLMDNVFASLAYLTALVIAWTYISICNNLRRQREYWRQAAYETLDQLRYVTLSHSALHQKIFGAAPEPQEKPRTH